MKKTLTQKQQEIFDFIERFMQKRGYPPTLREVCNEFGISSTNGVRVHIIALEKKNYIIRRRYLSRGIEIVDDQKSTQTESEIGYVPIIGKITPGEPVFAPDNIEGMLAIDNSFIATQKAFALKVSDNSMNGAGMIKGDYAIARRQHIAETGESVVFVIGDEIIIRRYDEKGDRVLMIPENEAYKVKKIRKNSSDLQIAGKVIGIMRKY